MRPRRELFAGGVLFSCVSALHVGLSMKHVLLGLGLLVGIIGGLLWAPERARPLWWQALVLLLCTAVVVAVLWIPIGGTWRDAVIASRAGAPEGSLPLLSRQEAAQRAPAPEVPVLVQVSPNVQYDSLSGVWSAEATDAAGQRAVVLFESPPPEELLRARQAILRVSRQGSDVLWRVQRVAQLEPAVVLPYIPGLDERARILYFHVPLAWGAVLAYAVAMIAAVAYLRRRQPRWEYRANAAALVGVLYTVLATVTGAIWARFNWGAFWNWDPRQTTILVLLFIYLAYFALRASLPEGERRWRLGNVYLVFAFVTVPFLVFVLPRLMESLHPGGRGDVNIGPVLSADPSALNPLKQILLSAAFAAFTLLLGWLWSLTVRSRALQERLMHITAGGEA
jgi:heme exporter protein C